MNLSIPQVSVFGAEGESGLTYISQGLGAYDCEFVPTSECCGIRMPFVMDQLVYCPSGAESEIVSIPLNLFKPSEISLPLSNGLLQIAPDLFLIKDTWYLHLAAHIFIRDKQVEYRIEGAGNNVRYHWRVYFLSACLREAVSFANVLNNA